MNKFIKEVIALAVVLGFIGGGVKVWAHKGEVHEEEKITAVTGEVVCYACYIEHDEGEGQGEKHKKCGLDCVRKGLPVGILEAKTKELYLVMLDMEDHVAPNEKLDPYFGQSVTIKGEAFKKKGVKLLTIKSVEKAGKK